MKTTATNRRLRELLNGVKTEKLVPRPDFQRRLVWVNRHKVNFIRTVLDGYPFPEIYIASEMIDDVTGDAVEILVDGQQRISTLYQYWIGSAEIDLENTIPPFSKLSKSQRDSYLQYEVVIRDLGNLEKSEIVEIFKRINSTNYSLNAMEIHNAMYDGEIKTTAESLLKSEFFEKHVVFSTNDIRRMQDTRYALTIIITMLDSYFNRDEELEAYLKNYNDDFRKKKSIVRRFNATIEMIEMANFADTSRIYKKTDLFTAIIEIDRAIQAGKTISPESLRVNLTKFYDAVDSIDETKPMKLAIQKDAYKYKMASIQASNDRSSRMLRGEIIGSIIGELCQGD